jgi:hypothetical protein
MAEQKHEPLTHVGPDESAALVTARIEPAPAGIVVPGSGGLTIAGIWRYQNAQAEEALFHFTYVATYTNPVLGPIANTALQAFSVPPGIQQGAPGVGGIAAGVPDSFLTLSQAEKDSMKAIPISTTQAQLPLIYYGGNPYRAIRSLFVRPNVGIVIVAWATPAGGGAGNTPAGLAMWGFLHGTTWLRGRLRKPEDVARALQQLDVGD